MPNCYSYESSIEETISRVVLDIRRHISDGEPTLRNPPAITAGTIDGEVDGAKAANTRCAER